MFGCRIFISRLSTRLGVEGAALRWFRSYLEDWSTCVEIRGKQSVVASNKVGLPQGSVFGPIHTLPVPDIARHYNVSYHTYAEDTQLYVTFDPKQPNGIDTASKPLSDYVTDISTWMGRNKLKLNEEKT